MTLAELQKNEEAEIIALENTGEIRRRLLDMGLVRGAIIKVIRKAPLGDPLEIKVKNFFLSLRRSEASGILVKKI